MNQNPYKQGRAGKVFDNINSTFSEQQEYNRGVKDQEEYDNYIRNAWENSGKIPEPEYNGQTEEEYQEWRKKFTVKQRQQAAVVGFISNIIMFGFGLYFWYNDNPIAALVLFIGTIGLLIINFQHKFHKELPPLSSIIDLDFEKVDEVLTKSSHAPDPTKWGEKLPVSVGAVFAIVGVIFSLLTGLILTVGYHSLKFSSTRTKGAFVFLAGAGSLFYIFKLAIKFKDNRNFDKGIHIFFMISLILFEIFALSIL